jgi:RNA polymerase sigma-70 factor (ECF subfamily)
MEISNLHATFNALRPRLMRFARLQLRDDAAAEDAVQETLLAAVQNAARFEGAAAVATWLFAILKNKLIDEFRRRARQPVVACDDDQALDDALDAQFDARGHWATPPSAWSDPQASLEQKRFWEVFEICIAGLPERSARVFGMRELMGLETEEICKQLGISSSNCWVLLHRARMGLRDCLSRRWFGEK